MKCIFQTRVFTPVLGSCTSVTVDSKCTTFEVIKTLLEKFKVHYYALIPIILFKIVKDFFMLLDVICVA